jgi:hypothetical protein
MLGTCIGAPLTLRRVYQPRTNIVKDDIGNLVADSHCILARWRNYFSQILCLCDIKDLKNIQVHLAHWLL